MTTIPALAKSLCISMEKGIKCDSWGQRLEAAEEYRRVYYSYHNGATNFCTTNTDEKEMTLIMENVKRRADMLECQMLDGSNDVSLDAIKESSEKMANILREFQAKLNKRHSSIALECGNNLLLPLKPQKDPSLTYLSIKIDKIGLKDAHVYVDPFLTVSVRDASGTECCPEQNTPSSYHVKEKFVIFDVNVHIAKAMEELPEDVAIFFEFKHYKEKSDKVSTRCFAFVERDEIHNGAAAIEIYKKPVDYSKKKLILFTEKTLYLHLYYSLEKGR